MRFSAEAYLRTLVSNPSLCGGDSCPLTGSFSLVLQTAGSEMVCLQQLLFQFNSVCVCGGGGLLQHSMLGFLGGRFLPPGCKQEATLRNHFFFFLEVS